MLNSFFLPSHRGIHARAYRGVAFETAEGRYQLGEDDTLMFYEGSTTFPVAKVKFVCGIRAGEEGRIIGNYWGMVRKDFEKEALIGDSEARKRAMLRAQSRLSTCVLSMNREPALGLPLGIVFNESIVEDARFLQAPDFPGMVTSPVLNIE